MMVSNTISYRLMHMSFNSNMIDWLVFNVQQAIFQLYSGRNSNMTGVTSGARTVYPSAASEFTQVFCGFVLLSL
jgi:hypothetical protein